VEQIIWSKAKLKVIRLENFQKLSWAEQSREVAQLRGFQIKNGKFYKRENESLAQLIVAWLQKKSSNIASWSENVFRH